jgi:hypothetical protein
MEKNTLIFVSFPNPVSSTHVHISPSPSSSYFYLHLPPHLPSVPPHLHLPSYLHLILISIFVLVSISLPSLSPFLFLSNTPYSSSFRSPYPRNLHLSPHIHLPVCDLYISSIPILCFLISYLPPYLPISLPPPHLHLLISISLPIFIFLLISTLLPSFIFQ